MANNDESSPADTINRKLDEIIAEQRRRHAPATTLPAPPSGNRLWLYLLCLLAAVGVHAIGYLIYTTAAEKSAPAPAATVPELTLVSSPPVVTDTSPPTSTPPPPPAAPIPVAPKAPTIVYQGKSVPYQPGPESEQHRQPRSRIISGDTRTVIVDSAPSTPPPGASPPANAAEAHAKVAKEHAYQHFRYKYKVGSANYTVTSLNIVIDETVELTNWNRFRTTGEAGIEYYDNASGKRTTRKFEVLTENKNGRIVPVDIIVK